MVNVKPKVWDTQLNIQVSEDIKDYVSYSAYLEGKTVSEYIRERLTPFKESPYEKMNLTWVDAPECLI